MVLLTAFYFVLTIWNLQVIAREERKIRVKRQTSPDEDDGSEVLFCVYGCVCLYMK